jgi:hypothetical protein
MVGVKGESPGRAVGVAVVRYERVQVHQPADVVRHPVRHRGDHGAAVAVPDEHESLRRQGRQRRGRVGDVPVERDRLRRWLGVARVEPAQGHRPRVVAPLAQRFDERVVPPAAVAGTGNQQDRRHELSFAL